MKPISTLRQPLESVDLPTRAPATAAYEHSDMAVAPAAGVIGEAMVSIVLARALTKPAGSTFEPTFARDYTARPEPRATKTSRLSPERQHAGVTRKLLDRTFDGERFGIDLPHQAR